MSIHICTLKIYIYTYMYELICVNVWILQMNVSISLCT